MIPLATPVKRVTFALFLGVLSLRAKREMCWLVASGRVAEMEHAKPLGNLLELVRFEVGKAVDALHAPIFRWPTADFADSVTALIGGARPYSAGLHAATILQPVAGFILFIFRNLRT